MTYATQAYPPPVGIQHPNPSFIPSLAARRNGHPLALLIRLREEAAEEIERLLAFLDATDGCEDACDDEREEEFEDEGAQCDDEGFGEVFPWAA